ncbi:MAG: hypothetical protein ACK8QZ_00370 [Anaerolineales bacterium]
MENWLLLHRPQATNSQPDWERTEKKHGRWEVRKVWLVSCDEEMQAYLQSKFGWPGVQACGWIVRYRKNLSSGKEEKTCSLWVAGAAFRWNLTAEQAAGLLRGHWGIENRIFYVRDVSMDEDRLSGRKIGYGLSNIRNIALNLLRTLAAPYVPDARRRLAARPDLGLPLLC